MWEPKFFQLSVAQQLPNSHFSWTGTNRTAFCIHLYPERQGYRFHIQTLFATGQSKNVQECKQCMKVAIQIILRHTARSCKLVRESLFQILMVDAVEQADHPTTTIAVEYNVIKHMMRQGLPYLCVMNGPVHIDSRIGSSEAKGVAHLKIKLGMSDLQDVMILALLNILLSEILLAINPFTNSPHERHWCDSLLRNRVNRTQFIMLLVNIHLLFWVEHFSTPPRLHQRMSTYKFLYWTCSDFLCWAWCCTWSAITTSHHQRHLPRRFQGLLRCSHRPDLAEGLWVRDEWRRVDCGCRSKHWVLDMWWGLAQSRHSLSNPASQHLHTWGWSASYHCNAVSWEQCKLTSQEWSDCFLQHRALQDLYTMIHLCLSGGWNYNPETSDLGKLQMWRLWGCCCCTTGLASWHSWGCEAQKGCCNRKTGWWAIWGCSLNMQETACCRKLSQSAAQDRSRSTVVQQCFVIETWNWLETPSVLSHWMLFKIRGKRNFPVKQPNNCDQR